jgi:protein-S-isoprenylcysteine O-methyltransferase Ste14
VAAPLAELAGLEPLPVLDRTPVRAAGAMLAVVGIAATLAAQQAMGRLLASRRRPRGAHRPGHHRAVPAGPQPDLHATAATAAGLALLVPNLVAAAMLAAFVAALQVQVRLVEEPYLQRVHGAAYARYAARTGRFLPGIGRGGAGARSA